MRIAVLDVDGTLIAGTLAGRLPMMLAEAGLVPRDRLERLRQAQSASDGEDPAAAARMNELFAAMLTDVPSRSVSAVMARLWQRQRERLFASTRPLAAALQDAGYVPLLISGGPQEMVAYLACELGVALFRGTQFEAADGLFTGRVASAVADGKDRAAQDLAGTGHIDWPDSLAVGNSLGDVSSLSRVGHPVAFEPSPALRALARRHSWPVCDRTSLLTHLRDQAALPVSPPAPAREVPPARHAAPVTSVGSAIRRLTERLLAQVGNQGAVTGECRSRVTESALMLTLLRRANALPGMQSRLHAYLSRSRTAAGAFDAAVIDATLHGTPPTDRHRLIEQTFSGAAQHSSDRKKLALEAILAVVGPEPFHVDAPSHAFEHHNEATWTRLRQMALHHLHVPDPVAPELTARLLRLTERGQDRGVIEGNVFAHLFALLSLHRTMPGHQVIHDGITALAEAVRDDGGMPFITSEEIFSTATAGLALARAGAKGQVLLAMGDYLAAQQAGNGGWAYAQDVVQTDTDTTTHVLSFLHAIGPERYRAHIALARQFLAAHLGEDGGMPTYLPGQPSEPTMTANALIALRPYHFTHAPLLEGATRYLLNAQKPDGTFERSWSLSEANAMLRALTALTLAHRHNPSSHQGHLGPAIDSIHQRLLVTANPDGGWGQTPGEASDAMSTAYTLTALAPTHRTHPTVRSGLHYLLGEQNPDGGYTSPSDQAAPRPLRYAIPVLTDIFVLLALTHYA
ncbi:haloacid dehalogenase-like hydrolase [Streptomyces sp. NBC_00878]|uniref:haloacid dehalogenase-like hydrolase n=1 Tax=Streptomyces sp. NBC_00878 TaxID=2975854 RepID=UPI00225AF358|nr:haloacid dehalogenase-like hydrolase [Streptomyces sp. NBC_00878]MCX4903974.1 haloacid dehalogenase-like hydrolase [Streptomyces sp. NBC_00878]